MNTTPPYPRLKPGIVFLDHETAQPLLLHEPSNRYFRLTEEGVRLLRFFDGTRSIEEVTRQFNASERRTIEPTAVRGLIANSFIRFLDLPASYGLEEVALERSTPSYLRLSTLVFSASRVARVTRHLRVLFITRVASILLLAAAGLFIIALTQYWGALAYYFNNAPLTAVGPFLFVMLTVSVVHELGHAAACRYFDVHHGGIGIGFYLLTPVMYADVTAAWRLPARQRMVINAAGMYFELICCLILLIALFITGEAVFLGFTLIVLVHTLYNLNPFFRTDGYWLLTDASGQSNLRRSSNRMLGSAVRRLFSGSSSAATTYKPWLAAYAAVSYVFITLFLYYVVFVFESSLFTFPIAFEDIYYDIRLHRPFTLTLVSEYLHRIIIPMIFYYLLLQFALRPLFRHLRQRYFSLQATTSS